MALGRIDSVSLRRAGKDMLLTEVPLYGVWLPVRCAELLPIRILTFRVVRVQCWRFCKAAAVISPADAHRLTGGGYPPLIIVLP